VSAFDFVEVIEVAIKTKCEIAKQCNQEVFMRNQGNKSPKLLTWISPLAAVLCCVSATQAHAKDVETKAKEYIDQSAGVLKKGIDKLGDDSAKIQDYVENYPWKGIIQDKASSGAETLSHLRLNHRGNVIAVHPGEKVEGKVICSLNSDLAHALSVYRVVIGLHGKGPQTTIGASLGVASGSSKEKFSFAAPSEPGIYQIRFRTADNYLESKALDAWVDENGKEPDASTTIGIIYVRA
jgi:hypothetical protein